MSISGRELSKPGKFDLHRSLTGATVADSGDLSDVNFPLANAFFGTGCESIWIYWTGDNPNGADEISFEVLIRDTVHNNWVAGPLLTLGHITAGTYNIYGSNLCYVRIATDNVVAENIKVYIAKAQHERIG